MTTYKFTIDKQFNWEMGHRVWAQKLNHAHLSITTDCACKHLHGHSYKLKVFLGSDTLDGSQMVTDFKNLNFMKKFVDDCLDHKFMIDIHDPHFERITGVSIIPGTPIENFSNLGTLLPSTNEEVQLHRDSFVLVNFVPTSENICKYLKHYAENQMAGVAHVCAVELWETEKSHCRYED